MKFWILVFFFVGCGLVFGQLPFVQYQWLVQNSRNYELIWSSDIKTGNWLIDHSEKGYDWKNIGKITGNSWNHYWLSSKIFGFVRVRWTNAKDTTTMFVKNRNQSQSEVLFACYDESNCKVDIQYQIQRDTDIILRFYNRFGEELTTHFLKYSPLTLEKWSFDVGKLPQDIFLVRLEDALSKEKLLDFRLELLPEFQFRK